MVPVPDAEPLVGTWRARLDPSARCGMPAHITALYPFLPEGRMTDGAVDRLREICAATPVQDLWFRRIGRFPGALYLAPEPADGLRALTERIALEWPEAPPYGGAYNEVIPHLTVAQQDPPDDLEAALMDGLPLRTSLTEAWLYVSDGTRWEPHTRLPFTV